MSASVSPVHRSAYTIDLGSYSTRYLFLRLCWNLLTYHMLLLPAFFLTKHINLPLHPSHKYKKRKNEKDWHKFSSGLCWSVVFRTPATFCLAKNPLWLLLHFRCLPWLCSGITPVWLWWLRVMSGWMWAVPQGPVPAAVWLRGSDADCLPASSWPRAGRFSLLARRILKLVHAHPAQSCCGRWVTGVGPELHLLRASACSH